MIAIQYVAWQGQFMEKFRVPETSEEFISMRALFAAKNLALSCLLQHRDENKYMQFLVRQQFLSRLYPHNTFYNVKKFIAVDESDVDKALKYNLDHRRCSVAETFATDLNSLADAKVIFVVLVTTDEPFTAFKPMRDSDFYIEYIAYLR